MITENHNVLKDGSILSLDNDAEGLYVVTTASGSRYVINFEEKTVTRHSADESDWFGDLKRNQKKHSVISLAMCQVGSGMILTIDEAVPGVKDQIGVNFTTSVVRIEKI